MRETTSQRSHLHPLNECSDVMSMCLGRRGRRERGKKGEKEGGGGKKGGINLHSDSHVAY